MFKINWGIALLNYLSTYESSNFDMASSVRTLTVFADYLPLQIIRTFRIVNTLLKSNFFEPVYYDVVQMCFQISTSLNDENAIPLCSPIVPLCNM